jgi:uncharacterized protein YciI
MIRLRPAVAALVLPLLTSTACAQEPAPSPSPGPTQTPAASAPGAQAPSSPAPGAQAAGGAPADAPRLVTYQFGLLRKGPKHGAHQGEERRKLQEAHLANIVRLAETGALVAAGPIEGPEDGDLRGIFVFKVASLDEARKLAETDPAVQVGRLKIDLLSLLGTSGIGARYAETKAKNGGKDEMVAYQLVLMKDGKHADSKDSAEGAQLALARRAWMDEVTKGGSLVMAGPFTGGEKGYRGLMVFRVSDGEAAAAIVRADPAVRTERMAFETHKWWVAKGVLE